MGWKLLTTPPKKSGCYIVAHRGHAEVIHYLKPNGNYNSTAQLGWQDDPRVFGATHYMPLPEVTIKQSAAANKDLKARGLVRVVESVINKIPVAILKPTRWQHFKAAFGWKWIPSYQPTTHNTVTDSIPDNPNDPRQVIKKA